MGYHKNQAISHANIFIHTAKIFGHCDDMNDDCRNVLESMELRLRCPF
jgi:hypothetical protein